MEKLDEKTIAIQTSIDIELLGSLVYQLRNNPQKTIRDFINEFQKSISWDKKEDYSIVNQGVVLTHLYGLIVYPKTAFHNEIPFIKLNQIDKNKWGHFEFKSFPNRLNSTDQSKFGVGKVTKESDMTLEFLIRKIRNSISHNRVEIFENMDFKFSDEDGSEILFTISELQKFVRQFRNCYISNKWE